jgi:hypothetical protein
MDHFFVARLASSDLDLVLNGYKQWIVNKSKKWKPPSGPASHAQKWPLGTASGNAAGYIYSNELQSG